MLYDLSVRGSKRKPEPGLVFFKSSFNLFSIFFHSEHPEMYQKISKNMILIDEGKKYELS